MLISETNFLVLICAMIQYFEKLVIWWTFLDFSKSNGDLINLEIRPQQQNLELKQALENNLKENKKNKTRMTRS
jgi:hypothetical protein